MTAPGIGAKLKTTRLGKGLGIDDISRDTRIAPRFIEAIETEDYNSLPGLVFARSFVRQYALILDLDPDPLLDALPKVDEYTAPLPNPPVAPRRRSTWRSTYRGERQMRALTSSALLLLFAGVVGGIAYLYFNHYSLRVVAPPDRSVVEAAGPATAPAKPALAVATPKDPEQPAPVPPTTSGTESAASTGTASTSASGPVTVSLTASARAWIRLDVDGKTTFMGTLTPNETREVSANEQVRLQTGNAGALTLSLNGKTLDSLGRFGQFREVRLTAEGPQFLQKDPPPQPAQP